MATRAEIVRQKLAKKQHEHRLKIRRLLDSRMNSNMFEPLIDFDKDLPAWENLCIGNPDEEWTMPLWKSLQAIKSLSMENASCKRMMKGQPDPRLPTLMAG